MNDTREPWSLVRSVVSEELKRFLRERVAQARAVRADNSQTPPRFASLLVAAENADWPAISQFFKEWREPSAQPETCSLLPTEWHVAFEIDSALNQFAAGVEEYTVAFGRDVIASIPPGSILLGGPYSPSDIVRALCRSVVNAEPFFLLGQSAMIDKGYLHYLRGMYGTRIYIPTEQDLTSALDKYRADARQRLREGKLLPGEDVREVEGQIQFNGMISAMAVNGLLTKLVFDQNRDRDFYIEESFPLEWMRPYLSPHGLILRIHRDALIELSEPVVQEDRQYWTHHIQPMIGDWLNFDTPIAEITAFIERVHLNEDLNGFKGDPRFVQNIHSQELFSRPRTSIGGVYEWRYRNAKSPQERARMLCEADFAYRQAFALAPHHPEGVYRYASVQVEAKRLDHAIVALETVVKLEPGHAVFPHMLKQIKTMNLQ